MAEEKPGPADEQKPGQRPKAFPIPTPIPDDNSTIHARPSDDDEDSVDFGAMPSNVSGSAILSQSQISGPLSGTSVVAWADLMKARAEEEAKLQYDSLDNIDLESASDEDLLAKALASEPPSGKLNIPKDDRPHGALSKEFIDLDAEENARGRRRKDDESILPSFSVDAQTSSIMPDMDRPGADDNSHINLLSHDDQSKDVDPTTDEIEIGNLVPDSGDSSAVDLGSEPVIDLPFPSSGISSGSGTRSNSGRSSASRRRGDSSTVDLLTGAAGHGLSSVPGLTSVGSSMRPDSGLPATKRVNVLGERSGGWLTGGLVGAMTGIAVCVGIWFSGALSGGKSPNNLQPANQPPPAVVDPVLAGLKTAFEQAKLDVNDPGSALNKLVQDKTSAESLAKQARDENQALETTQKTMHSQLSAAEAKATKTAQDKAAVDAQLQTAREELQAKENERKRLDEELKQTKAQMTATKPPLPPSTDNSELTKLKEQVDALQTKSAELERELTAATRTSESLKQTIRDIGSFVVAIRQRLQAPVDAKPGDLLTSLDAALASKPAAELGSQLPASVGVDPRAERAFHRGLGSFRYGNYADAEKEFQSAVGLQNRDARFWYFLGLSQSELGQTSKAEASFQQALERERRNMPAPDEIDALLERLPPAARQTINQIRGRG